MVRLVSQWGCSKTPKIHQGSLLPERGHLPHTTALPEYCLVVAAQNRIQAHSCVPMHKPTRVHVHTQESLPRCRHRAGLAESVSLCGAEGAHTRLWRSLK